MTTVCTKFIIQEQRNIFSRHMSKRTRNAIIVFTILGFLFGCFLPKHAAVLLPFFVSQSASDIREKMVATIPNNILLTYAVLIFLFSTPLKINASYIIVVAVVFLFSYGFKLYGSGDAKVISSVFLLTATMQFETDLFATLCFLSVSYSFAFIFVIAQKIVQKRKHIKPERHIYFYPFLFIGYVVEYIFL